METPDGKVKVRYNWPDVMKLIGMFCVFAMHTHRVDVYGFVFRSITLSLFFVPAGVFAGKTLTQPFRDFVKNGLLKIMVPYFIFSVIAAGCSMILTGDSPLALVVKILYGGREHLPGAALWFLPALFCVRLYFYVGGRLAQKLSANRKWQMVWLVVWSGIVCAVCCVIRNVFVQSKFIGMENFTLPWSADWAGIFLPIYLTGYLFADWLKKFSLKDCNMGWKFLSGACVMLVIAMVVKPEWWHRFYLLIQTPSLVLDSLIPEFLCSLPLLFGIFIIAKLLDRVNVLGKLGGETLYYCGLEAPFVLCVTGIGWLCSRYFPQITFVPGQWNFAVYVVVEMLFMIFVLTPISKKLFGKLF